MTYIDETRRAAGQIEHEWDYRAIDWPLNSKSVVVEIGGYIGRWALQIAERYHPHLYIFEPQPWAAQACGDALGDAARVLPYALGDRDGTFPMGAYETDGCSFLRPGDIPGTMREIGQAFKGLGLSHIDLMLMNIEGYEYTLLPYMLELGIRPARLMVQFHPFDDVQQAATARIFERLAALGYTVAWTYGLVLTAWERSQAPARSIPPARPAKPAKRGRRTA
jgi:FkbM family methyltransferase